MTDLNAGFERREITWAEIEAYEERAHALRAAAVAYGLSETKSFIVRGLKAFWQHCIVAPRAIADSALNRPHLRFDAPKRPDIFGATNA